jgi:FtsH-binding integral membrane protein
MTELTALLLCIGAVVAIFRFKEGLLQTLAASAAAGVALSLFGLTAQQSSSKARRACRPNDP